MRWVDVSGDSPDSQLGAKLALLAEGALGIFLVKYLRDSADRPDYRSLEDARRLPDKDFDRPYQEATLHSLNQMMRAQRKPGENWELFRSRFPELHGRLVINNAALHLAVLFSRALEDLNCLLRAEPWR